MGINMCTAIFSIFKNGYRNMNLKNLRIWKKEVLCTPVEDNDADVDDEEL